MEKIDPKVVASTRIYYDKLAPIIFDRKIIAYLLPALLSLPSYCHFSRKYTQVGNVPTLDSIFIILTGKPIDWLPDVYNYRI